MGMEIMPVATEVRIYADANGKYIIPEEYRSSVTYDSCVKSLAMMLYSEGVMANDRDRRLPECRQRGRVRFS